MVVLALMKVLVSVSMRRLLRSPAGETVASGQLLPLTLTQHPSRSFTVDWHSLMGRAAPYGAHIVSALPPTDTTMGGPAAIGMASSARDNSNYGGSSNYGGGRSGRSSPLLAFFAGSAQWPLQPL